jgi:hypothetical protein
LAESSSPFGAAKRPKYSRLPACFVRKIEETLS